MNYSKFHLTHNMMVFLLHAEANNYVCGGFYFFWRNHNLVASCLSVASSQLLLDNIITMYLITSDGSVPMSNEQAAYHQSLLVEMGDCFRHNTYTYILYLRCKDAMLVIRCTGLLITITLALAGEWLNSLYCNKCIKLMKRQLQICQH